VRGDDGEAAYRVQPARHDRNLPAAFQIFHASGKIEPMSRLLITGGLGLIGRGVLRALAKEGTDLDLRVADVRPGTLPGVEVLRGDVCDPEFMQQAIRGCDMVLHLAGHLGVERTESDFLTCLETNLIAGRDLLGLCLRHQVRVVLLASSSEIYGESGGHLGEDSDPRPRSVYAVAKLALEKYALAYHQRHGLDVRVARFFNVYGPWQRGDFVVSRFVRNLRRKRPPEVFGDGSQVRAFCHVDDAARAALSLLRAPAEIAERIVNIGSDREPISIKELAHKAIALSGLALEPSFVPFHESDRSATREIHFRVPDLTRARRLLGYEPAISLEEGLQQLISCARSTASRSA
jgi:UDP-glucose 4-epimerase